jgi:maltose O-acetyltransferase
VTTAEEATSRAFAAARDEVKPLKPWVSVSSAVIGCIPDYAFSRVRTHLFRLAGWQIGRGSLLYGVPEFSGSGTVRSNLEIGEMTFINVGCSFELSNRIVVGDHVALGHEVRILTSTHDLGPRSQRAGGLTTAPVSIQRGAWVGSRTLILPGVTIGAGAVIAAGSVVSRDVAPNTLVGGVPASVLVKRLPG